MGFNNRQYMIINVSELSDIDFSEVLETSASTVRKSLDGTKTFVKWNGDLPKSIVKQKAFGELYTYERILKILQGKEWHKEIDDPEAKKRKKIKDDAKTKKG